MILSNRLTTRKTGSTPIITVVKLDYSGRETYRYTGKLLDQTEHAVILEAFFDRDDTPVEELILQRNGLFVEYYFNDRWYNIFEIHDSASDRIKGWYCNIGYPAEFRDGLVSYRDLALDLLVYADGRQVILDQGEFEALPLTNDVESSARNALVDLQGLFADLTKGIDLTGFRGIFAGKVFQLPSDDC